MSNCKVIWFYISLPFNILGIKLLFKNLSYDEK